MSKITPCFSKRRSLQWAKADTQARVTVTRWSPWRQAADGTLCFSQNWMGCMWSRPNWSTSEAAAIMPSILWKALSGRAVPSSKEAAWRWIVKARSAETVAVICTELITVPRNETRWLGDSICSWQSWHWAPSNVSAWGGGSCAMLKPHPTRPKWASRRGSWVCEFPSVTEGRRAMIHASRKSAGSQGQPKREDLVLICHPFECESQESSVMLPGCESTHLCVFAKGFVSKWSSWTNFLSGRNSGVWDLE